MDQRRIVPYDADETGALGELGVSADALARGPHCPDPALVLAVEEGVIDDDLAVGVKAHVAACRACQLAVADLGRVFEDELSAAGRQRIDARVAGVRRAGRPARGAWFWFPALAAATAVMVGFIALRPDVTLPPPQGQQARANTAPPLPTVFHVDRPVVAAGQIDLAVRGEPTVVSVANRIGGALDVADAGDVKTAITRLEAVAREHPKSRDGHLALGAMLLRDSQTAPALAALERARGIAGTRSSDDEVDWFLAMALVRSGDVVRARVVLGPVCQRAGSRAAVACAGLRELERPPAPR